MFPLIILKKILFFFLLIFVLFLPTKSFYIFYLAILPLVTVLWLISEKNFKICIFSSFVIVFWLFIFTFRSMYFGNLEDFKELLKLVMVLMVFSIRSSVRFERLNSVFLVFVFLNFSIAFFQFFKIDYLGIVNNLKYLYSADKHVEASLSYFVPRALGLSSGPGQQGVVGLFFLVYFSSLRFLNEDKRLFVLCAIFVSILTILFSQSKTIIVALFVGVFVIFICSLFRLSYMKKIWFLLISGFSFCFFLFFKEKIVEKFPEIARIFEYGLNVSSFQSRMSNWRAVLQPAFEVDNWFFYIFGVGRSGLEYFRLNNLPYDSDYVYFYINYGLVGFFFIIGLYIFLLFNVWHFFGYKNYYVKFLQYLTVFGAVSSFSLNFVIDPRVYFLFSLFLSIAVYGKLEKR